MIIANTKTPTFEEFARLVAKTNAKLNHDAKLRPDFYKDKNGRKLELVVKEVMEQLAQGTAFDGSIELIGGQRFPDIVAQRYYGIEVKTTTQEHWTTIGNSVRESTRVEDVEHIFLLFGKLSGDVEFKARRYQDCLSDVVVTHSPRYKIDMDLPQGGTIFDKMNTNYDAMRKLPNPIVPVVAYYKSRLKDGESLWWIDNAESEALAQVPVKVRLWRTLSSEEKNYFTVKGLTYFPEILSKDNHKYDRFTLWLVTQYGIVSTSARDTFSAGGQVQIGSHMVPQVYSKFQLYKEQILEELLRDSTENINLLLHLQMKDISKEERINEWIRVVASFSDMQPPMAHDVLHIIFGDSFS